MFAAEATSESGHSRDTLNLFALRNTLSSISEPKLRESVIELFSFLHEATKSGEVFACVLAARRLSCLYLALTENGLPRLNCLVLTDKQLSTQIPREQWLGKRVMLIDDTVIVGTSLAYSYRDLQKLVGENGTVSVAAVCVDESKKSVALTNYMHLDAPERSSESVSRFSTDLAKTLNHNLLPYFGDYLFTQKSTVSVDVVSALLGSKKWCVAEVSTVAAGTPSTASYSFVPRDDAYGEFVDRLNVVWPGIAEIVNFAKVRSYVSLRGYAAHIRFVPLVTLKPASARTIVKLHSLVTASENRRSLSAYTDDELISMQRTLQVLAAAVLLEQFQQDETIQVQYEDYATEVNFGPKASAVIRSSLKRLQNPNAKFSEIHTSVDSGNDWKHPESHPERDLLSSEWGVEAVEFANSLPVPNRHVSIPEIGEVLGVGQEHAGRAAAVFSYLDDQFERPEQRAIRRFASAESYFKKFPNPSSRRLNRAISFSDVVQVVRPPTEGPWGTYFTSFVIDMLNDSGIAVPMTMVLGPERIVQRTYRVGENSSLGAFFRADSGRLHRRGGVMSKLADSRHWLSPWFETRSESLQQVSLGSLRRKPAIDWLEGYANAVRPRERAK